MLDLENFQETVASSQDSVIPFPTKTIDQLTPEEQVYFVKVGKDNITKFTDTNLKTFEGCRKDFQNLEPYIYGARRLLDYTGKTILIPVSRTDSNNKYYNQIGRENVNPEEKNITGNMFEDGFSLAERLPIMVVKLPSGKYLLIDGRTRFTILRDVFGMKNFIADVFECPMKDGKVDRGKLIVFAIRMNNMNKPQGEASVADIKKAILFLIENGDIQKSDNTTVGRQKMVDHINYFLDDMFCNSKNLTLQNKDLIIYEAIEKLTGGREVISFPNRKGVEEWFKENNYTNNKERVYLSFAMVTPHAALNAMISAQEYLDKNPNVKELKLVGYVGVIKSDNPEKSWEDNLNLKEKVIAMEILLGRSRFGNAARTSPIIELYGIIPQVFSLQVKYPMGSICLWPKDSAEG